MRRLRWITGIWVLVGVVVVVAVSNNCEDGEGGDGYLVHVV